MMSNQEINEFIAKNLFGLHWHDLELHGKHWKCQSCGGIFGGTFKEQQPNYAESIEDAFKVVAEMEKRKFKWIFTKLENNVLVSFLDLQHPSCFEAAAETLPLAICSASVSYLESLQSIEKHPQ